MLGYGGSERNCFFIQGKIGYINGIQELNNICDIYGHGVGATGGRLLTIEEINKMTGLNENNIDGNGTKYGAGTIYEYGNSVTYYWNGTDTPYYEASNGLKGNVSTHINGFTYYDESTKEWKTSPKSTTATTEKKEKITTIASNNYEYNVTITSMKTNNPKLYNTLFTNSSTGAYKEEYGNEAGIWYYLGSSAVCTGTSFTFWAINVAFDGVIGALNSCEISHASASVSGNQLGDFCGVRPVVSLKSNIKLKENGTRDNCTLYDLLEK